MVFGIRCFGSKPGFLRSLAVLAAAILGLACSSDEEKVSRFMERASEYKEAGQLDEAIIEFKNVLENKPV